ncbi:MAG: aminotransferase class IV [Planctomycetota bacterium]|jgi:D-alanine transaminase
MQIAMIEDRILPLAELEPVYMDRGMYFGDGVYEVVRSYDGKIFALNEHLARLARSLHEINITGVDIEQVRRRVEGAYESAGLANAKIYFHITRGSQLRNHTSTLEMKPNFFLTVTELPDDSKLKADGVRVCTFPDWRWKRCDIKSLNLLPNVLARTQAQRRGCAEAIFVDDAGYITEGASSAFFGVRAGDRRLVTRGLGADILESITRHFIIELAPQAGLTIAEEAMTPEEAQNSDELFIAVTTMDIVPVVEFDGAGIGKGQPGRYTKTLMEKFGQFVVGSS